MGNVLSKPSFYVNDLKKEYPCKKRKLWHCEKDDVRSFRMQEEFGPKKFIKP